MPGLLMRVFGCLQLLVWVGAHPPRCAVKRVFAEYQNHTFQYTTQKTHTSMVLFGRACGSFGLKPSPPRVPVLASKMCCYVQFVQFALVCTLLRVPQLTIHTEQENVRWRLV